MSVDKIMEGIQKELDKPIGVDYIQMTEQTDFIDRLSNLLLGVIVYIIVIGIPLIVILEVMYINIPIMRTKLDIIKDAQIKERKLLGFMFRDAELAIVRANTLQTGRSANFQYFIIKIKTILIAICCVSLVLGAGPIIVNLIVDIAKSIMIGFSQSIG